MRWEVNLFHQAQVHFRQVGAVVVLAVLAYNVHQVRGCDRVIGWTVQVQGLVSWRPMTVKWWHFSQSNRHSTIGTRQTEYHEALPSSANDEVRCDCTFANDGSASWYSVCRVPIVERWLDCENSRHLTVIGLHNTSSMVVQLLVLWRDCVYFLQSEVWLSYWMNCSLCGYTIIEWAGLCSSYQGCGSVIGGTVSAVICCIHSRSQTTTLRVVCKS